MLVEKSLKLYGPMLLIHCVLVGTRVGAL